MTEGLLGVLIGGAIGIASSLVVESLRTRSLRKENSRKYQYEINEKRKSTYFEIMEFFRKFEGKMWIWRTDPLGKIDLMDYWDSLTGYRSHLIFLPDPDSSFIDARVARLYDLILKSGDIAPTNHPARNKIAQDAAALINEIKFLFESGIITMNIELLRPMGPWKRRVEKIKDIVHKQPKESGGDSNNESH